MKLEPVKSESLNHGFINVRPIGSGFYTGVSQEDRDALYRWSGSQRFSESNWDSVCSKLSDVGLGIQEDLNCADE